MNLIYRQARPDDYAELMALYADFVNQPTRYAAHNNDSYLAALRDERCQVLVASESEKLVGFVAYSFRTVVRYPKPIVEVEEIYVVPAYRRRGIARELMRQVHDSPEARAAQYVFLASDKARTEAHDFYKSLGYDKYAFHFRKPNTPGA